SGHRVGVLCSSATPSIVATREPSGPSAELRPDDAAVSPASAASIPAASRSRTAAPVTPAVPAEEPSRGLPKNVPAGSPAIALLVGQYELGRIPWKIESRAAAPRARARGAR